MSNTIELSKTTLFDSDTKDTEDVLSETSCSIREDIASTADMRVLKAARRFLYIFQFCSKGSDVAWQFCLVLFLTAFTKKGDSGEGNLILVSSFYLMSGVAVCVIGGYVGSFIDETSRLHAMRIFIWINKLSVIVTTYCCYLLLIFCSGNDSITDNEDDTEKYGKGGRLDGVPISPYATWLLICLYIFGAIGIVFDRASTVSIENDWIVVISRFVSRYNDSDNDDPDDSVDDKKATDYLSKINVTMKQIELCCRTLTPMVAGYSLTRYSNDLADSALVVILITIICLIVELLCARNIYKLIPDLAVKLLDTSNDESHNDNLSQFKDYSKLDQKEETSLVMDKDSGIFADHLPNNKQEKNIFNIINKMTPLRWKIYIKQSIAWGGIAFSLLWLNILSMGAIMTGYLVCRGMPLES